MWDLANRKVLWRTEAASCCFSSDGRLLLTVANQGPVEQRAIETGKLIKTLGGLTAACRPRLVAARGAACVACLDRQPTGPVIYVWQPEMGQPTRLTLKPGQQLGKQEVVDLRSVPMGVPWRPGGTAGCWCCGTGACAWARNAC